MLDEAIEQFLTNRITDRLRKDILKFKEELTIRMDEIEKLIQSHAVGVQNVYDEFKKINDFNNIGNIDSQMLINGILKNGL